MSEKKLKPTNFYEHIAVLYLRGDTYVEIAKQLDKTRADVITGINQLRRLGVPLYRGRAGGISLDLKVLQKGLDLSRMLQLVKQEAGA